MLPWNTGIQLSNDAASYPEEQNRQPQCCEKLFLIDLNETNAEDDTKIWYTIWYTFHNITRK
jgi:hypothetical protein